MSSKKFGLIIIIPAVLIILWLAATPASPQVTLNGAVFTVELADTPDEQARGLSGRDSLGEREGMLFIFAATVTPAFWMREMNFPIDIIWLTDDWRVADISPALSPTTYPQTFSPRAPVKYVLEVASGTAQNLNLKIGDLIHFSN
jgi:hypothetical protein